MISSSHHIVFKIKQVRLTIFWVRPNIIETSSEALLHRAMFSTN